MYHYRKNSKIYENFPEPVSCPFCDPSQLSDIVRETEYAYVVPNRTFYDLWELQQVTDHLLVVPKLHVYSLAELPDAAKLDIINLIGEYEQGDYNVYARAVTNPTRSIAHQHTHLIKADQHPARALLHVRRPYLTIKL